MRRILFLLFLMMLTASVSAQDHKVTRKPKQPATPAVPAKPKTQPKTTSKPATKPSSFSIKEFVADGFNFIILNLSDVAVTPDKDNHIKGHLVIPEKVNHNGKEYKVVKVGHSIYHKTKSYTEFKHWGFFYNKYIMSVTIPYGVTDIEENAFTYCSRLTEIRISDNVKKIGKMAFRKCDALHSISIPESLIDYLGDGVFEYCKNLQSVTVRYPDGREDTIPLKDKWKKS